MTVVESEGRIAYEVEGKVYPSPSTAANAVAGHRCNGYVFWSMNRKTSAQSPSR